MENRSSNVSSTPTTVNQPAQPTSVPQPREDKSEMDPWTPLVLSLDGGGGGGGGLGGILIRSMRLIGLIRRGRREVDTTNGFSILGGLMG
jgi:hypothetical protein